MDILAHATEFSDLPVRHREENVLQQLAARLPIKIPDAKFNDPHVKANLLLQVSHRGHRVPPPPSPFSVVKSISQSDRLELINDDLPLP